MEWKESNVRRILHEIRLLFLNYAENKYVIEMDRLGTFYQLKITLVCLENERLFNPGCYVDFSKISYCHALQIYENEIRNRNFYLHGWDGGELSVQPYQGFGRAAHGDVPKGECIPGDNSIYFVLTLSVEYPARPPLLRLIQVPCHPNIRETGETCYNLIGRDYRPYYTLLSIVIGFRCFLEEGNMDDYVNYKARDLWARLK